MNALANIRLAVTAVLALAATTPAQSPPAPAEPANPGEAKSSPFGGPLWERSKLTGDWFGCRNTLEDCGLTIDLYNTQFGQGVASGGLEQTFKYGGRNDYFGTLDGEKAGLWDGFRINVHGETRYGESANFITGTLSPVNEMLFVPGPRGVVSGITALKFTQRISDNFEVAVGKFNLFDEFPQPLTGADQISGFLNTSLIFPFIFDRTMPYSLNGVRGFYSQDGELIASFSVFDTNSTPTTSGIEELFNNGAVLFATLTLPTRFFGLPGHQGLEAAYSSGKYTNLTPSPYIVSLEGVVQESAPKAGSWAVMYLFDQALYVSPEDPNRMWGVFGRLGISDGNPNPIRWYGLAGVSGWVPAAGRELDTFGVGVFYLGMSDQLKQSAFPDNPLRDEVGVDMYYNAQVSPWFQFTPNIQVVRPYQTEADTALVLGVRGKLAF